MAQPQLTQREKVVLAQTVLIFITTGAPVASRAVLEATGLQVSSATIRNVMASLEARGLLRQPHTSAGRVPTPEALRHYIEHMVTREPVAPQIDRQLRHTLAQPQSVEGLLQCASRVLSAFSSFAGLASPPDESLLRLRHVELVSLAPCRVLAVMVTDGDVVRDHVVELERPVSPTDLARMQNFLGEIIVGKTLVEARATLRRQIETEQIRCDAMIRDAVDVASKALEQEAGAALVVEGELNFLSLEDFGDLDRARKLLQALKDKRELLVILDGLGQTQERGTQVLVGPLLPDDSPSNSFHHCSFILSPYKRHGQTMGWIGVVGPLRMRYRWLIPLVETTADLVRQRLERPAWG